MESDKGPGVSSFCACRRADWEMYEAKNPVDLPVTKVETWKLHGGASIARENVVEKRVLDAGMLGDIREIDVPIGDLHARRRSLVQEGAALAEKVGDEGLSGVFLLGFDEIEDLDGCGIALQQKGHVRREGAVQRVVPHDLDGRPRHRHAHVLLPIPRNGPSHLRVRRDVSELVFDHRLHLHLVRHITLIVDASLQIPRARVHSTYLPGTAQPYRLRRAISVSWNCRSL